MAETQPGMVMLPIELVDQRQQAGKREGGIDPERDLAFPAVLHVARLLLQILRRPQQHPPFFQHQLAGIGELRPVAGAVQQGDVEIVFQLLHHIAECRRGLNSAAAAAAKDPCRSSASKISSASRFNLMLSPVYKKLNKSAKILRYL